MREGWQVRRIGEIANHVLGKMLDKAKNKGDLKPYLRNLNVRWFEFDLSDVQEMRFTPAEVERYSVKRGDLVICEGGYPGRGAIWDEDDPVFIQKALHRVRFSDEAYGKWCLYFLHSEDLAGRLKRQFTGSGIQHFTGEALSRFELPIPPLDQTRRIVAILDEAFEAIATAKANAEKNLLNARAVLDGHLRDVFSQLGQGWVQRRMQDVCEKITDGTHQTPKYFESGVVFLSSRNVTSGTIDWENIKYIDEKQHLEMHRRVAPKVGDILLAKNGTTGVAAIVDRDITFDIYVSLAMIRTRGAVLPRYLLRFINSPAAKLQFNKRLKGVGVPNLHLEEIREVFVPFPESLDEQQRIVDRLDEFYREIDGLIGLQQRKLIALDELKRSLLRQAFSGALATSLPDRQVAEVA